LNSYPFDWVCFYPIRKRSSNSATHLLKIELAKAFGYYLVDFGISVEAASSTWERMRSGWARRDSLYSTTM
jgi:hypothetical protein